MVAAQEVLTMVARAPAVRRIDLHKGERPIEVRDLSRRMLHNRVQDIPLDFYS